MTNAFSRLKEAQEATGKVDSSFATGTTGKGGRPSKIASEKRDKRLTVYMSTDELVELTSFCDELGVQPAVFLRTQALNAIKR